MMKNGQVGDMQSSKHFIANMNGKVWEMMMDAGELVEFQKTAVISNVFPVGDNVNVRVISEQKPSADAICKEPNLEDAYLYMFNYKGGKVA